MDTYEYIDEFLKESSLALFRINKPSMVSAIEVLFTAWKEGKQVFLIGNGGSASTATHFASDLVKTIKTNDTMKGLRALALSDNIPLVSALTNDTGWSDVYLDQLKTFYNPGDVLIVFSVHGGPEQIKQAHGHRISFVP